MGAILSKTKLCVGCHAGKFAVRFTVAGNYRRAVGRGKIITFRIIEGCGQNFSVFGCFVAGHRPHIPAWDVGQERGLLHGQVVWTFERHMNLTRDGFGSAAILGIEPPKTLLGAQTVCGVENP